MTEVTKEARILSSLLHIRDEPSWKGPEVELIPLEAEMREHAVAEIQKVIPGFDYHALLAQLKDREALKIKFNAAGSCLFCLLVSWVHCQGFSATAARRAAG